MYVLIASAIVFSLLHSGYAQSCPTGCQSCRWSGQDVQCDKCYSQFILLSHYQCQSCPTDCTKCNGDSDCAACKPGKYGYHCQSSCIGCSDGDCKKINGACNNGCIDEFYQKDDGKCQMCPENCTQCSAYENCSECEPGWYGPQCFSPCYGCIEDLCDKNSGFCTKGCVNGYYNDSNGTCLKCYNSCETCIKTYNNCTSCSKGFFYIPNNTCSTCSEHCKNDTICNKKDGSCEQGCADTWSGDRCLDRCSSGCTTCSQFNISACGSCNNYSYGESCEKNCSLGCKQNNEDGTCARSNGNCEFGCLDGFWGDKCEDTCGDGCIGGLCNRTTGECFNSCESKYHGSKCDKPCSENCLKMPNSSLGRFCDENNGSCLYGCRSGWFGDSCSEGCSKFCNGSDCNRYNGSCMSGCLHGYTGVRCKTAAQRLSDQSNNQVAIIGGGSSAGAAVLICVVILLAVGIYRKRRNSTSSEGTDQKQNVLQDIVCTNNGTSHKSNKATDSASIRKTPGLSSIEMDVCHYSKFRHTSDSFVLDKTSDRETTNKTETYALGVNENTYCNTESKRVAVEHLAEYIKNKRQDEVLNDFEKLPTGLLKECKEARKPTNVQKNKYRAIYPYDENRVVLQNGDDYINASFIDGYNRKKEYIASSGPFKKTYDTTPDFWQMVFQERCETIIMLTNIVEGGKTKCEKYWPDEAESVTHRDIHIACITEDHYADFCIRILSVTKDDETFNIYHLHFTAWPDKGIPHDVTSMIEFAQKVRSLHNDKEIPMLVHCSAGIGRTGTFIALDMLTNEGENRGSVDIFESVAGLRYQRCNMVQTAEQYLFLHYAVLHSLTFDCRCIPGEMFIQNYNKLAGRDDEESKLVKQFRQLLSISEEMTEEVRAEITKNKSLPQKNRSDADVPGDEYRVRLHENRNFGDSDYINAVYINSYRKPRKFIAAQSPLPSTVVDFLWLVWQEKCSCIVSMDELDKKDKTVKVYWPADNQVVKHGDFEVSCKESKTTTHWATKKLSIIYQGQRGEETRDVCMFIFTEWPKGSIVPNSADSLLELVKTVDILNRKSEFEPPILIHCRTGAQRSCLYCAVSVLIEKMEIEHEISVVNTLRQIKARRLSAISNIEEYKFCHQAVVCYLKSFDIYSNFGMKTTERKTV